jgi:hypothetical protein
MLGKGMVARMTYVSITPFVNVHIERGMLLSLLCYFEELGELTKLSPYLRDPLQKFLLLMLSLL